LTRQFGGPPITQASLSGAAAAASALATTQRSTEFPTITSGAHGATFATSTYLATRGAGSAVSGATPGGSKPTGGFGSLVTNAALAASTSSSLSASGLNATGLHGASSVSGASLGPISPSSSALPAGAQATACSIGTSAAAPSTPPHKSEGRRPARFADRIKTLTGKESSTISSIPSSANLPLSVLAASMVEQRRRARPSTTVSETRNVKAVQRSKASGSSSSGETSEATGNAANEDEAPLDIDEETAEKLRKAALARDSRQRKKAFLENLEMEYRALQDENLQLKAQLELLSHPGAAIDVQYRMVEEKCAAIREELAQIVSRSEEQKGTLSEEDDKLLRNCISDYMQCLRTYQASSSHLLERLEREFTPSIPARFVIWALTQSDPQTAGLWPSLLMEHVGFTPEQLAQTEQFKAQMVSVKNELAQCLSFAHQFKDFMEEHFQRLNHLMESIQRYFTPIQLAKFYLWIQDNQWLLQLVPSVPNMTAGALATSLAPAPASQHAPPVKQEHDAFISPLHSDHEAKLDDLSHTSLPHYSLSSNLGSLPTLDPYLHPTQVGSLAVTAPPVAHPLRSQAASHISTNPAIQQASSQFSNVQSQMQPTGVPSTAASAAGTALSASVFAHFPVADLGGHDRVPPLQDYGSVSGDIGLYDDAI